MIRIIKEYFLHQIRLLRVNFLVHTHYATMHVCLDRSVRNSLICSYCSLVQVFINLYLHSPCYFQAWRNETWLRSSCIAPQGSPCAPVSDDHPVSAWCRRIADRRCSRTPSYLALSWFLANELRNVLQNFSYEKGTPRKSVQNKNRVRHVPTPDSYSYLAKFLACGFCRRLMISTINGWSKVSNSWLMTIWL